MRPRTAPPLRRWPWTCRSALRVGAPSSTSNADERRAAHGRAARRLSSPILSAVSSADVPQRLELLLEAARAVPVVVRRCEALRRAGAVDDPGRRGVHPVRVVLAQ